MLLFSLLINFLLLGFIGYSYYTESNEKKYFKYIKASNGPIQITTDTTSVICFVGNSITANWINLSPDFFTNHMFFNKGVGGQSSTQILLRFQHDILSLRPSVVVLNTGINDIGENDGFYKEWFTLSNIQSMIDICNSNNIQIVLTSVLPATEIKINRFKSIDGVHDKIKSLNKGISKLAAENNLIYVNYYDLLVDNQGSFNEKYTFDGVHPNKAGYTKKKKKILPVLKNISHN